MSEAMGKYYGSLPKFSRLTADGNPLIDDNMLEPESRAPRPLESRHSSSLPDVNDDEDQRTWNIPLAVGHGALLNWNHRSSSGMSAVKKTWRINTSSIDLALGKESLLSTENKINVLPLVEDL